MTSLDASPRAAGTTWTHVLRPAALALFALLVAAQLAVLIFTWWEPTFDGTIRYDDIAQINGAYWPMNVLLGGPGYALGAVAAAAFLVVLGVGRGNPLALIGAGLYLVGGIVFALVITAEVLPFAWATDPSLVGESQGRLLVDSYNDNLDAFLPYILGSMAVTALGAVLAVAGAAISGSLSWWVPAVSLAIVVGLFVLPLGNPFAVVPDLAQHALWIYIGWRGLHALISADQR